MMWPRLSKEFSEVARWQAVSHNRGFAAICSGDILPPTRSIASQMRRLSRARLEDDEAICVANEDPLE
jgi:hypothetical protein